MKYWYIQYILFFTNIQHKLNFTHCPSKRLIFFLIHKEILTGNPIGKANTCQGFLILSRRKMKFDGTQKVEMKNSTCLDENVL